eukprot:CAMPEP_0116888552 /NCGR_PEP_ID=MMETSP0463-20121206/23645_1 /TAXON_ID=181622 /ORGANISM="Strombidinopsis sp, Strain SopsisLIS2011" /LENGTH=86 /DNA_ID=CAMNT_0004553573 /DNA_START=493 /DNA_END=753 /DNA_ORIENTATION=+
MVQEKADILKSDRYELVRQYQEIIFVSEFIKVQATETSPLEFLQMSTGHSEIKHQIQRHWPKVSSDLSTDMKFVGNFVLKGGDNNV